VTERLTEAQCWALFERLFPNGLDDHALVEELAPEGWDQSPLVLVSHPTAEQVYEETVQIRENLRNSLKNEPVSSNEEPPLTLDAVKRDMVDRALNPVEECADLLGCCLWDIFADNHDVMTADRILVDLGSFRSAAGFIADVRHRRSTQEGFGDRGDYIEFYMGTTMVRHRADLMPVYKLIFRRMRQIGLSWRYAHPRLYAIDLSPLRDLAEDDDAPEAIRYDPTENFWLERHLAERRTELAEFRQSVDEAYRACIQNACDGPPPATVRAYQQVYGHDPDGWPPRVEEQA